jgi:diguanylate cyclase (GGDEF)-like protein
MNDVRLAFDLLQSLGLAILRRTGPRRYVLFGHAPEFYARYFPPPANDLCVTPWESSSMLEIFLDDAEKFFEDASPGTLSSGIWQEEGTVEDSAAFEAFAATYGTEHVIVIRLLQEEFAVRTEMLRKARAELLEKRGLTHDLELFKEKARTDGLTSILNRSTFMELLQEAMRRSRLTASPLALLMIDIDHFKQVNDTYGHLVGDGVLQELGKLLMERVRRDDVVARYGGEEFVLLVPRSDAKTAYRIGEELRKRIAAHKVDKLPAITVSIGCTEHLSGEDAATFIDRADKALYAAKKSGRNAVHTS